MFDESAIHRLLHPDGDSFDPGQQLLRSRGGAHDLCWNARYASYVIVLKQEAYYCRARQILQRLLTLQDTDPDSPTFGLWSYTLEESLQEMGFPDFNVADFVAKTFLDILYRNPQVLPEAEKEALIPGLRRAIECSIRRNIAPDYTNISIISAMTILSAGELLGDERYFAIGKSRLRKLFDYTRFNTGFSEYNSSDYTLLDIEEISRMLDFFKDPEAREMAETLNFYAWDMLTSHFNLSIGQLSPPQSRAYIDLEQGRIQALLYLGTGGRFGKIESLQAVAPPWLIVGLRCPELCMERLRCREQWIDHRFYRRNDLISPEEETAIILNRNSPDLYARTYRTEGYSMGSFSFSDLWKQRRTCMLLWGKDKPCYLRLRGLRDGKDFCSAVSCAAQYKNIMLGYVGFVTDRGSGHYIIDQNKCGPYDTAQLSFRFELGGHPEEVTVTQQGNAFLFDASGLRIRLTVWAWFYDGTPGQLFFDAHSGCVELVCFDGAPRAFSPKELGKTYGIFTIEVDPDTDPIPVLREENGRIEAALSTPQALLRVAGSTLPIPFDDAAELSASC